MGIEIIGRKNKSGQLTIFIILAIVLAVGIVLLFFLVKKPYLEKSSVENPEQYIDSCIKDSLKDSISKILENGGVIKPELSILYKNHTYNYLCYQKNYYLTCINHAPLLKSSVENEIKKNSEEDVKKCLSTLIQELRKKNFDVSEGEFSWNLELIPDGIKTEINKKIDISKQDSSQSFSKFKSNFVSSLYELIDIAREIVNQEAQYCNFDYNGFMLLYPKYRITRIEYDFSKIYTIQDRNSKKEFKFAIRSCAMPPGL